jgi:hypothetical protein
VCVRVTALVQGMAQTGGSPKVCVHARSAVSSSRTLPLMACSDQDGVCFRCPRSAVLLLCCCCHCCCSAAAAAAVCCCCGVFVSQQAQANSFQMLMPLALPAPDAAAAGYGAAPGYGHPPPAAGFTGQPGYGGY